MLVLAPWSGFWDRNLFLTTSPSLRDLVHNSFVRGAVSGIGVVTVLAGLVEIAAMFAARRTAERGDHASI
ncbi:MAG: hypothetical protein ACRD09_12495 [Vicinamibacterales bacterium]